METNKVTTPSCIANDAGKAQYNISLALDLRQIRKPGTYKIETFDKETSTAFHFKITFSTAPYVCPRRETEEERHQRIEVRKAADKAKRYQNLNYAFEKTARQGKAPLSMMAKAIGVSKKSIRRYIHEFSDEFHIKNSTITRLSEADHDHFKL